MQCKKNDYEKFTVMYPRERCLPLVCKDGSRRPISGECTGELPVHKTKYFKYGTSSNKKKTSVTTNIKNSKLRTPTAKKTTTSTSKNSITLKLKKYDILDDTIAEDILNILDVQNLKDTRMSLISNQIFKYFFEKLKITDRGIITTFLLRLILDSGLDSYNAEDILKFVDFLSIFNERKTSIEMARNITYLMGQLKKESKSNKDFFPYGTKTVFQRVYKFYHKILLKDK